VGLGPVFFSAQGGFSHRSIHCEPVPIDPAYLLKLLDTRLPEGQENTRFQPFLESITRCRGRTQICLVERLPLAAGAQGVENGVRTAPIRDARASPAKAVRIDMGGQEWLQYGPQLIGNL
jgi:hypothetical protein